MCRVRVFACARSELTLGKRWDRQTDRQTDARPLLYTLTVVDVADVAGVIRNKLHRLTERDSRREHYFALCWGFGLLLGYLASSGAISDVTFLLGDPDFL